MTEHLKSASLDETAKAKIRNLEQALGKHMMAYEPSVKIAQLTPAELDQIQALEAELGVTLLVYEA
jgi:triosephosphate isomerase